MKHIVRRALAASVVLGLAVLSLTVAPGARADGYVFAEAYFPSADGTQLHAWVYRPTGVTDAVPVILTVSPYASSGGDTLGPSPTGSATPGPGGFLGGMVDRGYAAVVVSLRGYGGSGGCFDLGGLGEQADVAAAIEWAGTQDWSDGHVGMVGHSYDGLTGVMGLASGNRHLDAVVTTSPPSGYDNYFSHGLRETGGGHGFSAFYAAGDLLPPSVYSSQEQHTNALSEPTSNPACYSGTVAGSYEPDQAAPYWVDRDLVPKLAAADVHVPTILVQGFNDWQVRPNAVADVWNALHGPRRLVLGPWDHGYDRGSDAWVTEVTAWFDEHLRGAPGLDAPRVRIQAADGTWRSEPDWPPHDATGWDLPILAGLYLDAPGNNGETGLPQVFPVGSPAPLPTGQGSWTFTPPLGAETRVSGVPTFTADLTTIVPGAHVAVLVYDIAPDGTAVFVTRGAAPAALAAEGFTLYPLDWRFPAGHRVGVLVSGADDVWFEPPTTGAPVTVNGGVLTLPRLGHPREAEIPGPWDARRPHAPFTVDQATIADRTAEV